MKVRKSFIIDKPHSVYWSLNSLEKLLRWFFVYFIEKVEK